MTVCARDPAGNVTRAYDEITLDTTNPGAVLVVEDGASFTNDRTVTVQLKKAYGTESVSPAEYDDIVGMSVNADDCSAASYTTFVDTVTVLLEDTEGDQEISVCVQDAAGRVGLAGPETIHLRHRTAHARRDDCRRRCLHHLENGGRGFLLPGRCHQMGNVSWG